MTQISGYSGVLQFARSVLALIRSIVSFQLSLQSNEMDKNMELFTAIVVC